MSTADTRLTEQQIYDLRARTLQTQAYAIQALIVTEVSGAPAFDPKRVVKAVTSNDLTHLIPGQDDA